jgi:hypothetical protein
VLAVEIVAEGAQALVATQNVIEDDAEIGSLSAAQLAKVLWR